MWKKTKEMKWKTAKLLWGDLFYDIAGAVLFAAGVYTFAENADFAPGGITGISLLLNHVFGIPVGTLTLFINLPLIVISYRTLGKRFLLKTAKSMVITTFFLDVVFPVFPMYEGQRKHRKNDIKKKCCDHHFFLMSFFRCFRCMKDRG